MSPTSSGVGLIQFNPSSSFAAVTFLSRTTKCSRPNGSPKGQRSAVILGMKEFSYSRHWIILAVPQHCSSKLGTAFGLHKISRFLKNNQPHSRHWIILAAPQHCSSNLGTAFGLHKIWIILAVPQHCSSKLGTAFGLHKIWIILAVPQPSKLGTAFGLHKISRFLEK